MRKKLPLISGILNVLEKLKGNTGIIENTSVATHTIAAGKYVIWKNDLYKASSAISIGDTLSLSNLTAVSDGIANELNSKLVEYTNLTGSADYTNTPITTQDLLKYTFITIGINIGDGRKYCFTTFPTNVLLDGSEVASDSTYYTSSLEVICVKLYNGYLQYKLAGITGWAPYIALY